MYSPSPSPSPSLVVTHSLALNLTLSLTRPPPHPLPHSSSSSTSLSLHSLGLSYCPSLPISTFSISTFSISRLAITLHSTFASANFHFHLLTLLYCLPTYVLPIRPHLIYDSPLISHFLSYLPAPHLYFQPHISLTFTSPSISPLFSPLPLSLPSHHPTSTSPPAT